MEYKLLYKRLLLFFWINLIVVAGISLYLLYLKGFGFDMGAGSSVLFEQYSIIITLACIPLSLKLFHSQYKKIQQLDAEVFIKKYAIAYILRMIVLDIVIAVNVVGIYLYDSRNAIFMTLITIFALFFCFPDKKAPDHSNNINENLNQE